MVNSLVAKSFKDVEVSADWQKPTEANGVLSSYQLCLAAAPLRAQDSPSPSSSSCRHVSVSLNCVTLDVVQFISLYFKNLQL